MTVTENIEKIYGVMPKNPMHLSYKLVSSDATFAAGKAEIRKEEMIIETENKIISLPFTSVIPKRSKTYPILITVTEDEEIPNKFLPAEEIVDRGYGIYIISAKDICTFTNKKDGIYLKIIGSRRKSNSSGEIAVIAWAYERLAECIFDRHAGKIETLIATGHGIFARASLLAGGYSEKITHVIANCVFSRPVPFSERRKNSGFTVKDLPLLYSPAFDDQPFGDETEALINFCKSKSIMIGSAADGDESDIEYEASVINKFFQSPEKTKRKSPVKTLWQSENFSYHIREGVDYFSRDDWKIYLDFIDKNLNNP